jgi:hypothetical protein
MIIDRQFSTTTFSLDNSQGFSAFPETVQDELQLFVRVCGGKGSPDKGFFRWDSRGNDGVGKNPEFP